MHFLIGEVINYFASSFHMESVYDQIVIKTWKGEEMNIKQILLGFSI